MPPLIHTFSDEINYLIWRYLRESSALSLYPVNPQRLQFVDLTQTAWTLEAEIKGKSGKDIVSVHEEVGRNIPFDLPKRLRMSMQYQEVLKHMSEVCISVYWFDCIGGRFTLYRSIYIVIRT
jgi:hypothetical protein